MSRPFTDRRTGPSSDTVLIASEGSLCDICDKVPQETVVLPQASSLASRANGPQGGRGNSCEAGGLDLEAAMQLDHPIHKVLVAQR
jgi:hypothetical protein